MIRRIIKSPPARLSLCISLFLSLAFTLPSYADGTGKWASGEETYRKVCAYCHEAGVGPYLLGRQFPAVVIQFIARNGLRAMPAMKPGFIDDVALKNVAEFIEKSTAGPNAPKVSFMESSVQITDSGSRTYAQGEVPESLAAIKPARNEE
jgi:mono/diheme cytochrome c family protein